MSGHSHWATTHRQKEIDGAKRGNLYSKLSRGIQIAIKAGGGPNPESNFQLKVAIEKARAANLPKENIERAISNAANAANEEATYEGFGPAGVSVIVEVVTDNRNRSAQEMKNLFERVGGNLAGPGAVSFNFDPKGFILVQKEEGKVEDQMLQLIDLGVQDMEETPDGIEVYVAPETLSSTKTALEGAGFVIKSYELTKKPKNFVEITDSGSASKVVAFLDSLEEHDDVQKVYANADISDDVLAQMTSN